MLDIKVSENIKTLTPYQPGKPIEEVELELGIKNSIKIASNENCIGASPKAVEAIINYAKNIYYYPDGDCYYLKKELSEKHKIPTTRLIIGNGSNEIIEMLVRALVMQGEEIIISTPSFAVYRIIAKAANIKCIEVPMTEGDLQYDTKNILSAITPKTKIIFFANPNNPTGTIITKSSFEAFIQKVRKDILVVMDEAYFEFVTTKDYPNSFDYQNKYPNIITLRSFSKIYGLAGLRVGFAIADEAVVGYVNKIRQPFNVNSLAQVAARAALTDTKHLKDTIELNKKGLAYLESELHKINNINFVKSYANFILINIKKDCMETYNKLLHKGVIVRPMKAWGLPNYIRVSVGNMEQNTRFIKEFKEVIR